MKNILLTSVLALCASSLVAQTNVSGAYIDSLSQEPVPFATVALTPSGTQQPEQVSLTDIDGKFSLVSKKNGDYTLSISMMGNRPYSQNLSFNGKAVELGTVWAVEESEKLEGVTVVAVRPVVRTEVDRIAYDIENDPDAPVKTVLDMMKKTPMVSVSASDEITVNGSTSFQIYVNDRRSSMFDKDPGKVMKGMPAEAVKSIEVITSPGAKYDAEGVGCIINLVMSRKNSMQGISGSVRAEWIAHMSRSAGYYLTAKAGKAMISSNGSFYGNDEEFNLTYNNYSNPAGQPRSGYALTGLQRSTNPNGNAFLEMSYDIDSLRLFTATLNAWAGEFTNDISNQIGEYYQGGTITDYLDITNVYNAHWKGFALDLGYERKFGQRSTLTFLTHYQKSPKNGSSSKNTYDPLPGYHAPEIMRSVDSETDENSSEFIAQADFVTALGEKQKLEFGAKFTRRNNGTDGTARYIDSNTKAQIYTEDTELDQKQNIYAAYAGYALNLGRFGLKAGVRSETSDLGVKTNTAAGLNSYGYDNTDIVPSLYLNYKISDSQNVNFNYVMRITRPGTSYLNPHTNETEPGVLFHGNPDLESERHNRVTAQYTLGTQKFYLSTNFSLNYSNNAILQYLYDDPVSEFVHSTYGNVGELLRTRLSLYAKYTFGPKTSFIVNAGTGYNNILASSLGERTEGWDYDLQLALDQQLPLGVRGSFWFAARSARIDFQTENTGYVLPGFDLTRSFFEDRLNVQFTWQNPFTKYIVQGQKKWSKEQRTEVEADFHVRTVRFAVSYRFGKLKASLRKTSQSIDNSDYMKGEQKGR